MQFKRFVLSATILGLSLLTSSSVSGQDVTIQVQVLGNVSGDPEKAEVQKRTQAFLDALGTGSAKDVAGMWTINGEYHGQNGLTIRGRDEIQKAYRGYLEKNTRKGITAAGSSVRFLTRDTAVEEGKFKLKGNTPLESSTVRYNALYVKEDGQWKIGILREWAHGPSIQELDWLIGSWSVGGPEGDNAQVTFTWSENQTYILGKFAIKKGDKTINGTQVIALSPATGNVRSWSFGSEGGLEESTWSRQEKRWVINSKGELPEGEKTSATSFLTPVDNDTVTWQTVNQVVDGEKLKDGPAVKLSRAKNP